MPYDLEVRWTGSDSGATSRMSGDLAELLAPCDLRTLEADPSTIYALTRDARIAWTNPAWDRFALDNGATWEAGAWGPGSALGDAIPEVLRIFYEQLHERAKHAADPVEHDYECSSPTVRRTFRMRLLRCTSGALVVVNALRREQPHEGGAGPDDAALYVGAEGLVVQCSHCRRVRRVLDPDVWEWAPSFVSAPEERLVSHGLCRICFDYHYPEMGPDQVLT
jgi:hypothetical protein